MKKLFLLALTCVLSLSLLGCDDSKATTSTPQPAAGNEPPKLSNNPKKELGSRTTVEP